MAALLKAGADPNAGGTLGPFGRSPLYFASSKGHTEGWMTGLFRHFTGADTGHAEVVASLLKAGADPNKGDTFFSVISSAPSTTDPTIQKMLEDAQTLRAAGKPYKTEL